AAPPERVLEHSRLGVGAVKDGDVVPGGAGPARGQDRLGDEVGLLVLVPGAVDGRALALPVLGPEPLVLPRDVVGDHRGGERENPLRRAIVLLEPDDPGARIVRLEVEDVPDVRSSRGPRAARSTSSSATIWFFAALIRWTIDAGVHVRSVMSSSRMHSFTSWRRASSS